MYPANANGPSGFGNGRALNGTVPASGGGPEVRHALAGLQAGVLGALLLVACLMIGSLWNGRSIWVVPNLFATTFFGSGVYRNQLLRTSWTGIALIVVFYGLLGVLWGCIWRDQRKRWLGFYGAVAGLCVYFFLYDFLMRHLNPLITLYAPDRQLQLGHLVWGMVLARSPLFARRIAHSTSSDSTSADSTSAHSGGDLNGQLRGDLNGQLRGDLGGGLSNAPAVHDDTAGQEIRSGEVIR